MKKNQCGFSLKKLRFISQLTSTRKTWIFILFSMLPHSLQDVGHLFPLPLGPDVVADPLLEELQTPE